MTNRTKEGHDQAAVLRAGVILVVGLLALQALAADPSRDPTPPEYEAKVMPAGWRDDPQVLAAGKRIYEGRLNPDVKCGECHGSDGKPTRKGRGSPDLTDPAVTAKDSDGRWFWRVSEGVPRTKMQGYRDRLTEEQRWQVIAYMRGFVPKGR